MIDRFIWAASGAGLSEHAWAAAEESGAAWVGNDAAAHVSLLRSTVREELAFGMEQQGIAPEIMAARIDAAMDTWGLRHIAEREPSRLSTGQTRRLAVAAALLRDPGSLVLDCPTDGLDAAAVETLRVTLAEFDGAVTVYDRVRTVLADDARTEMRLDGTEEDAPDPVPSSSPSAAPGEPVLTMANVGVTRGSFALGPVNLNVLGGQVTHLGGPNGSGKTTLMLAVLGLLPHEGTLDTPVAGWAPTGMDAAFSRRTVLKELAVGTDEAHAEAALRWVGLERWRDVHPLDVPSSPRRMLAVAAALVRGPGLLILDEPTVGLDAEGYAWLARVMRGYATGEYHAELTSAGVTPLWSGERPAVLWSCHNAAFADAVSDRSAMLDNLA
ncbi:ABC transporter ATP-binding protein [Corynebacterium sp. CNJ-954]|jgi:energy-coupling factor transporter ATP-binding protein EcfA2|uniref:ATP-binding cassette domain-containing protein n=1 Tax=Corynebacterium sp. CNJ-954 TaxID=1904962 RepID=UPI000964C2D7|nr:ATP-binding cassette domain-containing protein [Corynebacterium sp. CNJ-954]OLT49978.1 ABC transporter ATP-binding protein [Corynebacterium sp. CNJ-954]